jgi:hypothetical protein
MQIRNNRGEVIGEINTSFTDKGDRITTNTVYDRGNPIIQNISVRDNQGNVRTAGEVGQR